MKKSVILIISALSLVATIIIGLIFQRAEVYNVTIYINEIVLTHVRLGDQMFETYYDETQNLYQIENKDKPGTRLTLAYVPELTVDIIYQIFPAETTNQSVGFFTDPSSLIAKVDSETGRVVFLDEGQETFTVRANDNSNKSARIRLRAKIPEA